LGTADSIGIEPMVVVHVLINAGNRKSTIRMPRPRVFGLTPGKTQIPEKFLSRFSRGEGPGASSSYPQGMTGV
jgi:hypothetical protein